MRVFFLICLVSGLCVSRYGIEGAVEKSHENFLSYEKDSCFVSQEALSLVPESLRLCWEQHRGCEFLAKLINHYHVFTQIYQSCGESFHLGWGSYLFDGQTYCYCEKMYEKQKLLYEQAKHASNVLEVGVYMGHSIFIMLLANPRLQITAVDIDDRFSRPALQILENYFDTKIRFFLGDSLSVLPSLKGSFDFFHIDAEHDVEHLSFELKECLKKSSRACVCCVIDDYDCYPEYIEQFFMRNTDFTVIQQHIPCCAWRNVVVHLNMIPSL